jgi:hypothetical protein
MVQMEDEFTLKYGRRPPKLTAALLLGPLLTGAMPKPPASVDGGQYFSGWQMLGNDQAGDCVAVTWANQRALVTAALDGTVRYPDQDQVWAFYRTQNPKFDPKGDPGTTGPGSPSDGGMDIQTALESLLHDGGPDGAKPAAFAKVDWQNERELRLAHAIFGQVWYGVNVQRANEQEFSAGRRWTYTAAGGSLGGHSVNGIGYAPRDYEFVTWAKATEWTESFRRHLVEEAWVVVWPENLGSKQFMEGINASQLAADFQALTGRPMTAA